MRIINLDEERSVDDMFDAFIARPKIDRLEGELRQEFEELTSRPEPSVEEIKGLIKRCKERREALFQELENIYHSHIQEN